MSDLIDDPALFFDEDKDLEPEDASVPCDVLMDKVLLSLEPLRLRLSDPPIEPLFVIVVETSFDVPPV